MRGNAIKVSIISRLMNPKKAKQVSNFHLHYSANGSGPRPDLTNNTGLSFFSVQIPQLVLHILSTSIMQYNVALYCHINLSVVHIFLK